MTYTTIQGDTWDGISFKLFGATKFSVNLMTANPGHLTTVIFKAGTALKVPVIPVEQAETLPPWKREE